MAAASPAKKLQDEVTCSICLDYFEDPVMIVECGHNFCRGCITENCRGSGCSASCPECRHLFSWKNLKPNRQLKNIVETAKQLSLQLDNSSETESMCKAHQKPLTLFCKTDESLLCQVCERSEVHRSHAVVPTEEAAAHYKKKLWKDLENLKEERNQIQSAKSNGVKPSQELLKEIQAKSQEIVSEFQQKQKVLKDEEELQLSKLRDLQKEIERKRDDYASKFVDEISYITDLIGDVEKKEKQPANEFLQNIKSMMVRCNKSKFQCPAVPDTSDMKKRLNLFCQERTSQHSSSRECRGDVAKFGRGDSASPVPATTLAPAQQKKTQTHHTAQQPFLNPTLSPGYSNTVQPYDASVPGVPSPFQYLFNMFVPPASARQHENMLRPKWIKENVLLDPETAHPRYVVSSDWKSVSWGDVRQQFPYNPKRFQRVRGVLGWEGFTSGKHYWTVDVGDGDYWAVGVARESVERVEEIDLEPDEGIWAIGRYGDQYKALTSPPTLLEVEEEPTEIQVSLNYDAGIVHFYDAEDRTRLFTFPSVDFEGEKIFPFFRIVDSSTVLNLYS